METKESNMGRTEGSMGTTESSSECKSGKKKRTGEIKDHDIKKKRREKNSYSKLQPFFVVVSFIDN